MNINIGNGLLGSVALLVMVLSACGGENPTPPASKPPNAAPEVAASAQLAKAAILQLTGSALDETLPGGELTTEWTQVSGPGPVVFADSSRIDTTATFTTAGTYVLRLTASDGEFTITDDVTVVVQP
jgi:hypothetical protein